jgi:precorrin-6Y C5,15-methyltransferase (decarboxylating)
MKKLVDSADMLVGGERLLDFFKTFSGEKIIIGAKASETASKAFDAASEGKNIVVLASGDSLFFGIGALLSKKSGPENLTIIPNVTAAQTLFSKINQPWKNARFYSSHGRGDSLPWRDILSCDLCAIYADPTNTASKIASYLIEKCPSASERKAAIGEKLGMEDEKVTAGTLGKIAGIESVGMSVLALLPTEKLADTGIPLGLPDTEYAHENNLITHEEIRAVALSKLRLGPGVMWDLGAGSGSVGIEAAALLPSLAVYSVEQKAERIEHIKTNVESFGLANVMVECGNSLDVIHKLPAPRAVFIGGGGADIKEILEKTYDRLLPGGRIVVSAIVMETKAILAETMKDARTEALTISISRAKPVGNGAYMKSENPIDLYIYTAKATEKRKFFNE